MTKRKLLLSSIVLCALICAVLGGFWYKSTTKPHSSNKDSSSAKNTTAQNTTSQKSSSDTPTPRPPDTYQYGWYMQYSVADFQSRSGDWRILFFYALRDKNSRELDKSIRAGKVPKGMTIFQVDYDALANLRQEYAVQSPGTIIELDSQGHEIKRSANVASLDSLLAALK